MVYLAERIFINDPLVVNTNFEKPFLKALNFKFQEQNNLQKKYYEMLI